MIPYIYIYTRAYIYMYTCTEGMTIHRRAIYVPAQYEKFTNHVLKDTVDCMVIMKLCKQTIVFNDKRSQILYT